MTRSQTAHDGAVGTAHDRAVGTAHDDGVVEAEAALTRMMRQAARPSMWRKLAAAGGLSLDRAAYLTLVRIEEADPDAGARLTSLAEAMGIDISTVSRQVRAVELAGLVERTCDPSDHRASRLRLTPLGRSTVDRARQVSQAAMRQLLESWTIEERRTLAGLVERLVDQMAAFAPVEMAASR